MKNYSFHSNLLFDDYKFLLFKKRFVVMLLLIVPILALAQTKNASSACTVSLDPKNIYCAGESGKITVELTTSETGAFMLDWSGSATAIPSITHIVTAGDIDPATGLFQGDILTVSGLNPGDYFLQITSPGGDICLAQTIINFIDFLPPSSCSGGTVYATTDPGLCTATIDNGVEESCGYTIFIQGDNGIAAGSVGFVVFNYNSIQCTFEVYVWDLEPPSINCPSSVSATVTDGTCSKAVSWNVTASDNCGIYSINSNCIYPDGSQAACASGSQYPVGTTTVVSTATDNFGNRMTCTFTVVVNNASPGTLVFTGNIPDGIYHANQDIISNGNVPTSGNVGFKAGQCVKLDQGFTVQPGADFSGEIDDCN